MTDEIQESDELEDEFEEDDFDEDEFIPRIVILGAGPTGIEAALYARYLGYEVAVIERGTVANNLLRWGHVTMFSPFAMNRSSLGVAALQAQDESLELPEPDALLTGKAFAEQYLVPLSKSDLLLGCIHENVEVLRVGRDGILKTDAEKSDSLERREFRFRVLVRSASGEEDVIDADVVIDTTGVFDQPNFLGHGGIPAIGETDCRSQIFWHVPDVLGKAREKFENKRVLVVGSGYSAATNVVALNQLKQASPQTTITWVTRRDSPESGPIPVHETDPLESRATLARAANSADVNNYDQTSVIAIRWDESTAQFTVSLGGKLSGEHVFDAVIANVGYRPNGDIYSELQLEICPLSQAPKKVADWLFALGPIDAVKQSSPGAAVLIQREPNFYILGSKSFGRNSNFLLALGLQQVRDAFTVIAGRDDLDLYETMSNLVSG